jgi:catechol 2,3-dioxygenase-like lactoylglutathione lyase family enzyme
VGVPVTDQDRALSFYVGMLGFDKRLDVPIGGGKRWIVVGAPQGTATIALVASGEGAPAGVETGIRLISNDADTDHAALLAAGVDAGEVLRWEGVPPMFAFRDQDGNGLEIVEEARG